MTNRTPTSLIIIQPTAFCNIGCSYCYLPNTADRRMFKLEQLEIALKNLFLFPTFGDSVTLCWHAGEPLVLGPSYYEKAFALVEQYRPRSLGVAHALQTNGTLLNDAWCELFQRWQVGVGVSIDGPIQYHDVKRVTRKGAGTFEKTLNGIRHLQSANLEFNVISVLTRESLQDPEAMFHFYRDNDISQVCFNVEENEGRHTNSSLYEDKDPLVLDKFFATFTDLMVQHDYPIYVREFERTSWLLQNSDGRGVNEEVVPFGIISIDVAGDIFTFSPELIGHSSPRYQSYSVGNVFRDDFSAIRQSSTMTRMSEEIAEGVAMCDRDCGYFSICGGGSPANKMSENGTFASTETLQCAMIKKVTTDFVLRSILSREQSDVAPG